MGNWKKDIKSRSWIATIQIANMEKAGLTKEIYEKPEVLADFFINKWTESGKGRSAGIAVCVSEKGLYHAHMALYGNLTTLRNVSKILYNAHVEPQLAGKKALAGYLKKEPPYDEKGEQVLFCKNIEAVQDAQGGRSDLEEIQNLLEQGLTPDEILETNFSYYRYEKMIKSAFIKKRTKETPLVKNHYAEWHVGASGTGKSYYYYQLCQKHTPEKIYFASDFENGGFDFYIEQGAPPILFLDEFKGNMRFEQLLLILDKYSRSQTHCRYTNTYNLWTTCIITSIYPPEEAYSFMVEDNRKNRDKIEQLIRRLDVIVYHYKEDGEYKTFSLPASEYINYDDLRQRAFKNNQEFVPVQDCENIPFDDEQEKSDKS